MILIVLIGAFFGRSPLAHPLVQCCFLIKWSSGPQVLIDADVKIPSEEAACMFFKIIIPRDRPTGLVRPPGEKQYSCICYSRAIVRDLIKVGQSWYGCFLREVNV